MKATPTKTLMLGPPGSALRTVCSIVAQRRRRKIQRCGTCRRWCAQFSSFRRGPSPSLSRRSLCAALCASGSASWEHTGRRLAEHTMPPRSAPSSALMHEWKWEAGERLQRLKPYEPVMQLKLEEAFARDGAAATVRFSFDDHRYIIRHVDATHPVAEVSWIQEREDDKRLWRAVKRLPKRQRRKRSLAAAFSTAAEAEVEEEEEEEATAGRWSRRRSSSSSRRG